MDRLLHKWCAVWAVILAGACGDGSGSGSDSSGAEGQLSLTISAQTSALGVIDRARFAIEILSIGDDGSQSQHLVINEVTSNGPSGALFFLASCRAGAAASVPRLGLARVTLEAVYATGSDTPLEAALPMTVTQIFSCYREQDTAVTIAFDVVRPLPAGTTDLVVEVEQIECAAKIDCARALIPNVDGTRGDGIVAALNCAGTTTASQDDLLALTHRVRCIDLEGAEVDITDSVPQQTFTGTALIPGGGESSYWNVATRLDETEIGDMARCTYEAVGIVRTQARGLPRSHRVVQSGVAFHWLAEVSWDGAVQCAGDLELEPLVLRIDDQPQPSDSTVPASEAPVTWTSAVVFSGGEPGVLRLWTAGAVTFPQPAAGRTAVPSQDEELQVGGSNIDFIGACAAVRPDPSQPAREVWVLVDSKGASGPQRLGAVRLHRDGDERWGCELEEAGQTCKLFAYTAVTCDPDEARP